MMKIFKIVTLGFLLILVGCKSTKNIVASSGNLNNKLSAKELIKNHQDKETNFKTLQSRVKVNYTNGDKSQGVTVKLRIEKDKTIWISEAILGSVKALITPNKVQFYNKWTNEYFDGDYALISELLGTELDFDKLQNLLLGEAIYNLDNDKYIVSTNDKVYILKPKKQRELFELFLLLDPMHFKMASLQLKQPLEQRILNIDYSTYQDIEKQKLPENIKIVAIENTDEVKISLELKSITLNENLRFPFRIPSGFDEIIIK